MGTSLCGRELGEGIDQRASKLYRARYRDKDGRQHSLSAFATVTAARVWRRQQMADVDRGAHVAPSDGTTVAAFASLWAESRPGEASSTKRLRGMLTHLTGTSLGAMRLADVRPMHVQSWATSRATLLAPSTLARTYGFVQSVFKSAVANGMLTRTPCVDITLPRVAQVERAVLTVEQVRRLAQAMPARYGAAVVLQGTLGLRVGELLGLREEDVDREARVLHVRRQLLQDGRTFSLPKGRKTRTVPLPRHLGAALATHVLAYPSVDGLLFTSANGNPLRYDVYAEKVFRPAVARAGLPAGTGTHALRHAAGSHMLAERVPVTTVAKVLGHSVKVLLETHAHALPNADDQAREAMESAWAVSRTVSRAASGQR